MSEFSSHFDEHGASRMVNVREKPVTQRFARAAGVVRMAAETLRTIREASVSKGDVLEVARLAGIMAAKRTSDLIPLCHPLPLDGVEISFSFPSDDAVEIEASVDALSRTGVEMEALTAVCVAALTIYDMCKGLDKSISIDSIFLKEKRGGRSGHLLRTSLSEACRGGKS